MTTVLRLSPNSSMEGVYSLPREEQNIIHILKYGIFNIYKRKEIEHLLRNTDKAILYNTYSQRIYIGDKSIKLR
jgi:hypothetical protein